MDAPRDFFCGTPRELLDRVRDLEPGPLVWSLLLLVDPADLGPEDAITYLQEHERVSAWWAARQNRALVSAAATEPRIDEYRILDPRPDHDEERVIRIADSVREEVAAALRWSPSTTQHRIDVARLLDGPLSAAREAMASGEVSPAHVGVMAEEASRFPGGLAVLRGDATDDDRACFADACAALLARVLHVARRSTVARTRAAARRAALAIDADGAEQRRQRARCTRDVFLVDDGDGQSLLMARMATERAVAVLAAVDAVARGAKADGLRPGLTMGERRAEALELLVLGSGHPEAVGLRAHLDIVIDLPALLALGGAEPAELVGQGPLSAEAVRELLADPDVAVTMRRLVTEPLTGHLLDYGRRVYEVPARLREFIVARDRVCRFPGCHRRASRCQIDHAVAWGDGGTTSPDNLGAACTRHHQLKTHGGWTITESAADGSCRWRSPQGRSYDADPP